MNKYLHQVLVPSAATESTIYTVPDATTGVLKSLRVTNANASSATITVTQYNAGSGTTHYLQKEKNLIANGSFDVFSGVSCVLETGDTLKVQSSVGSVHFYLSYLEVDRN